MAEVTTPEVIFTTTSLVFLLIGIVLLISIVMAVANPYNQIAFANVEKLRSSMNHACLNNDPLNPVTISFSLPQNKPSLTAIFTVMPIWLINTNGDPNYVVYYEAFPQSDAVGWEVYQNMHNRLIVPYPAGREGDNYQDVKDFIKEVRDTAEGKGIDPITGVVINNIILSNKIYLDQEDERTSLGTTADIGQDILKDVGEYGDWEKKDHDETPSQGDNVFSFTNYMSLNTFEKSAIKYIPCGAQSLCLKTRDGVHRFPLRNCDDIKAVQLVYNGVGDVNYQTQVAESLGIGGGVTVGKFLSGLGIKGWFKRVPYIGATVLLYDLIANVLERHISFKVSNFDVVSPCSINEMKITKASCTQAQQSIDGYIDASYTPCTNVVKYPLYEYDTKSEKLIAVRDSKGKEVEHYVCVESVGNEIDDIPGSAADKFSSQDVCLQVSITELKDDYCWTPNPYKNAGGFWEWVTTTDAIRGAFGIFFESPVPLNSGYIADTQTVVLGPTDVALEKGKGLLDAFDRKWWWGWPG